MIWWDNSKTLEDLSTDGRIILNEKKDLNEIVWERVDTIHLAQDEDQWRALVNTAMNLTVSHQMRGISWLHG